MSPMSPLNSIKLENPKIIISWSEPDGDVPPQYTVGLYADNVDEIIDFACVDDDDSPNGILCRPAVLQLCADHGIDAAGISICWDL